MIQQLLFDITVIETANRDEADSELRWTQKGFSRRNFRDKKRGTSTSEFH